MVRVLFAESRIVRTPDRRGEPDTAFTVEHAIVIARLARPNPFVAPVGRWLHWSFSHRNRRIWIAHRRWEVFGAVRFRIEDRNDIDAKLCRAVHRAVGVNGWIATVGGDKVVQVMFVVEPVPSGDDDVALHALRSRWLGMGQFALGDPIGPVRKIGKSRGAELFDCRLEHGYTALT